MPLTRAHWVAGLVIFVTFAIEAWEMLILIFSAGAVATDFGLSETQIGSLISAMFLGMIPGSLLWGHLSNTLGRKKCLMWSIGGYAIFPALTYIAPTYEMLWAVRFIGGVVLAGALVVSFPLFMELLPVAARGRATVLLSAGWPLGTLMAVTVTASFSGFGWRVVLGLSTLMGLWALVIARAVPESAYWLAEKGRSDEASRVVSRLSQGTLQPQRVDPTGDALQSPRFLGLFSKPVIKLTILSTIINFCFAWGYWGMTSWLPELLSQRGLSQGEGLSFIALSALFMFPGYLAASYLTSKLGRKKVMVAFVGLSTVAGIGFGLSQSVTQMYVWNFALSFFSLGAWGVWNTWLGEIYDTVNRSPGTAWGVMLQRVANSIAPVVIGIVVVSSGFAGTILFISAFLAATFLGAMFLPETEGEQLT